ncbi:MAG: hypothetical protein U5L96_10095 [Owenweeksia sp.]|nr:hypothetical protein [Owenweeksia sp.]
MHTNVFAFEQAHRLHKTGYLREDSMRGYFAMVNVYNFLADSIRFDRYEDYGLLLGRIFINREGHFFVEGKKRLGFLYTNLALQKANKKTIKEVVDTAIIQGLEHDLTVPDYRDVMLVSVREIRETSQQLHLKTSKKVELGYYSRMEGRSKKF